MSLLALIYAAQITADNNSLLPITFSGLTLEQAYSKEKNPCNNLILHWCVLRLHFNCRLKIRRFHILVASVLVLRVFSVSEYCVISRTIITFLFQRGNYRCRHIFWNKKLLLKVCLLSFVLTELNGNFSTTIFIRIWNYSTYRLFDRYQFFGFQKQLFKWTVNMKKKLIFRARSHLLIARRLSCPCPAALF